MNSDTLLISFAIIGALVMLVCYWPAGPRETERDHSDDLDFYGATTCADLNDGRPCDVCGTVEESRVGLIDPPNVDPARCVDDDKIIKGFSSNSIRRRIKDPATWGSE